MAQERLSLLTRRSFLIRAVAITTGAVLAVVAPPKAGATKETALGDKKPEEPDAVVPVTLTPSPPASTPTPSSGPTREGEGPAPIVTPTRRSRLDSMEGAHLGGGPCGGSLATLGGAVGIAAILARRRGNEAK